MPHITLPDVASALATVTSVANPLFTSLLGIGLFGLGLLIGGIFVAWVLRKIQAAVRQVTGGRRGGGRRRR